MVILLLLRLNKLFLLSFISKFSFIIFLSLSLSLFLISLLIWLEVDFNKLFSLFSFSLKLLIIFLFKWGIYVRPFSTSFLFLDFPFS